MVRKPTTEFRMVCANHGTMGHQAHTWMKKNRKVADEAVLKANEWAATVGTPYRMGEVPYHAQARTLTQWEDVE